MELLKYAEESAGLKLRVDMYGGGPDKDAAQAKSSKMGLDMPFHGPIDHAALDFTHKVCSSCIRGVCLLDSVSHNFGASVRLPFRFL
jgi:hypothetical protein